MSIVEKMTRAKCAQLGQNPDALGGWWEVYAMDAQEWLQHALTATGLTEAQLEGLANGTHVVIERPRFDEGSRHMNVDMFPNEPWHDAVRRAMLAAKEG